LDFKWPKFPDKTEFSLLHFSRVQSFAFHIINNPQLLHPFTDYRV
jgi:hypothetical protein